MRNRPAPKQPPPELSIEILAEEFEYIAGTASQANEDRARVASFYLLAVGSLVAALLGTQLVADFDSLETLSLLFCGLFLALTILGSLTVIQLARLRAAWYESMRALNQIKEYAIQRDPPLARAFRWRRESLPPVFKANSLSFQQCLEVALLSGLTFGAAIHFLQIGLESTCTACNWAFTSAGALLVFLLQLALYRRSLEKR